jgi:hypothetical protein
MPHSQPGVGGDTKTAFTHIDYFAVPDISLRIRQFGHYGTAEPWTVSLLIKGIALLFSEKTCKDTHAALSPFPV